MITLRKKNFAASSLSSAISAGAAQLAVAPGEGAKFPAGGRFRAVLWGAPYTNPSDDPGAEVVEAELNAGDAFDVARGMEGTSGRAWSASDNFAHVLTAGTLAEMEAAIENGAAGVMLNAFRIAVVGSLSVQKMVDGIVDEFEDEAGVDAAASINESYDAPGDFYLPAYGSDQCSGGTATDDDTHGDPSFQPDKAFDNNTGTRWSVAGSGPLPHWIKYDFGAGNAKAITKLRLYPFANDVSAFKVQASNDNFASETVELYSYSGSALAAQWNEFTFANPTAYRCYRIYVTAPANDNWVSLYEVEMMEGGVMTLVSNAFAAESQPASARVVVFEEDVDAVTVNADLKAWASRDGGATWTQITLSDEGDYETGKRILTGTADVSAQPSGSSMKWKLTTHNAKQLKVHGVSLSWA